jgi:hypothetical protein
MTTTTAPNWTEMRRLPDGHRLFFTSEPNLVAIADNSGRTPEMTADGILWVNFDDTIKVSGHNAFIPVIEEGTGREFSTPTDFDTVFLLSQDYMMNIELHGIKFCARRV